ncbi:hypothetical protein CSR02_12670, partial [Acetobacter pomorum]
MMRRERFFLFTQTMHDPKGSQNPSSLSPLAQSWRRSRRTEGAMVYEGPKFGGTDVGLIWGGNGTETPQIWDAMRNGTPTEMEQKAPQSWNGKADIVFGRILEAHPQRTLRP